MAEALALDLSGSAPSALDRAPIPPPEPEPWLAALPAPEAPPAEPGARRLLIPTYDLSAALRLERELGIGHALAQILVRRGLTEPARAAGFLAAELERPDAPLPGIGPAVARIREHLARGAQITVHGDYDVDGVCATAIMVRALRDLGARVSWFLPSRIEDGYGLTTATVERLAARGTDLIVTVDCAITAVEEVEAARAAGLEVVVTDHHAPRADGRLPDCPIVHPGFGEYPFPGLCGAAVAHRLAGALEAGTAAEDSELVALATVADLVPLLDENRRLVRQGLRALSVTRRPGLRALMEVSRVDPSAIDAHALGFRLAPRINASGRMQRADAGLELLLTEDHERAREIARELDAVNLDRRAVEQRILWEAETQVSHLGPRAAYVLWSEDWHPGVIGIVASRIVERHHRPAVLIALDGEHGTGSGRSIPGFDLLAGLQACAPVLTRYGGHRAAAGLTVARSQLAALAEGFTAHAAAALTPDLLEPVERVDAVVSGGELGLGLAEELEQLEPCGMGNPTPRLLVPGGRFLDIRPMGEGRHARFALSAAGARARAVAFGCEDGLGPDADAARDATFKLELNTWNGAVEPRLVLRHHQPCRSASIELCADYDRTATDQGAYLGVVLSELDREAAPGPHALAAEDRQLIDRRGHGPLSVLRDVGAAGGAVLAICADVGRRLPGLSSRTGGFALASFCALERSSELLAGFDHLVVLDPPSGLEQARLLRAGAGYTHLSWSDPELRFAQHMHELEYALRPSLVDLYRALRQRQSAVGDELARVLRGEARHPRSAALAARLLRVLSELELVRVQRTPVSVSLAGRMETQLERSPSYRIYAQRYKDGLRCLSSAEPASA
jgi:single-stranded-DNA-specific exonuclease